MIDKFPQTDENNPLLKRQEMIHRILAAKIIIASMEGTDINKNQLRDEFDDLQNLPQSELEKQLAAADKILNDPELDEADKIEALETATELI
jgi:hypothetical protein